MSKDDKNNKEVISLTAVADEGRIDKFLTNELEDMSRSKIQLLIEEKNVLVNNEPIKSNYKVQTNDEIQIYIPEPEPIDVIPEDIPLDILYEDEDVVVVNKPQGMVVHPAAGHSKGTSVNALLYHIKDISGINGKILSGIMHQVDIDTSGYYVITYNVMT